MKMRGGFKVESHIVPEDTANDVAEHITAFLDPLACWCGPYRDTDEPLVIIHREEGKA